MTNTFQYFPLPLNKTIIKFSILFFTALDFRCRCTRQKLQSICAVLTFDLQLKKIFNIFCKRQILIKLFYLYQRLEYRDNYFKIKLTWFNLLFPIVVSVHTWPIRLFRIVSIPTTFHLFRVLTSETLGRRLPVFTQICFLS
jgi:hypothetical protein